MPDTRVNGARHPSVAKPGPAAANLPAPGQGGAAGEHSHRLQQALADLEALSQAQAWREQRAATAIAALRDRVIQLEYEVAHVQRLGTHDELTDLPNRSLLRDRLGQAIRQAAREQGRVGLLLLDLDGFKSINDRFGHAAGDKALQLVAARLRAAIRREDTACRFGGDEFVVLLHRVEGAEGATEVARKLRARLNEPYVVNGHSVSITASFGVAVYPEDGRSQNELIHCADIAMYRAKPQNCGPVRSFLPAIGGSRGQPD